MNISIDTYIRKAGEDIALTQDERERMRHTVHSYMDMRPLRAPFARTHHFPSLSLFSVRAIAATLVIAIFASSVGISYAAESALPGDLLYPIKTNVNESVQGALAVSTSAKAAWAMGVAGERVKEAATLAAAGRLSTSTQEELQQSFAAHAGAAAQAITAEASSSPEIGAQAAVDFQAQLEEYDRILAQVGAAKGVDTTALSASVRSESAHFASIRAGAQAHLSDASGTDIAIAAARAQASARSEIDASFGFARDASTALASSSLTQVVAQLDDASTTLSSGEKLLGADSPAALGLFQHALSASTRIGVFLQTSAAIHAHTGLVISEPESSASSTVAGSRSAEKKEVAAHALPQRAAALMRTFNASSSTSTEDDLRTAATTSASGSSSNESRDDRASHQNIFTLPVSVPTPALP